MSESEVICDLSQKTRNQPLFVVQWATEGGGCEGEQQGGKEATCKKDKKNAVRDDVQEELPAAAAAGWKKGSTEGPFQPQEAQLVQELQGAPAGAEDRRGRVAKRAKSPPPTSSTSSSL